MQQIPRGKVHPLTPQTDPNRGIQRSISSKLVGIVKKDEGSRNLLFALLEVPLLPRPPCSVHVAVVEVKDGIGWRAVRVGHGAV